MVGIANGSMALDETPRRWISRTAARAPTRPTFNVLMTPLTGTPMSAAMSDNNKLRAIVTAAARSALSQSVEMTIPVHDLSGPEAHGFYFFATDRAPKPGEWKYLTQGMINIDGTPFAFTILTNDGQEAIAKAALELIRNASCHPRTTT
jgi:hypothetical protein